MQSELARPGIAPYTATKGAIKNLTRGMCADWAKYGLQINATAPGYFKTPLNQALVDIPEFSSWLEKRTPAGRWGDVEELVGAAVFLSAGRRPSSTDIRSIDGGITMGQDSRTFACPQCKRVQRYIIESAVTEAWLAPKK